MNEIVVPFDLPPYLLQKFLCSEFLTLEDICRLDITSESNKLQDRRKRLLNALHSSYVTLKGLPLPMGPIHLKWITFRRISLQSIHFTGDFNSQLLSWFQDKHCIRNLKILRLTNIYNMPCNKLQFVAEHSVRLIILDFRGYDNFSDDILLQFGNHCRYLEELILEDCELISDSGLESIALNCTLLKIINFNFCRRITNRSVTNITKTSKDLHTIEISRCKVTYLILQELSKNCQKLNRLCIDGCESIRDWTFHDFIIKQIHLKSLSLDCCRLLSDTSLGSIASSCHELEELNVNYCHFITDVGIIELAQHGTHIQCLSLMSLPQLTDEALYAIASKCLHLTLLNVNHCPLLTDSGVTTLVMACTQLRTLLLHSTCITDSSLDYIASESIRLETLNLSGCKLITDYGIERVVSSCQQLKKLSISSFFNSSLPALLKSINPRLYLSTGVR